MFDTIFGLPLHVLVIHAVVVLVPVAALLAITYAARPSWRRALAWPTVVTTVVGSGSAVVAASSGEELQRRLALLGEVSPALRTHTEAGDLARLVALAFAVVTLAAVLWALRPVTSTGEAPGDGPLQTGLRVLLVLVALAALVAVVRAGHTGAEVAWADVIRSTE